MPWRRCFHDWTLIQHIMIQIIKHTINTGSNARSRGTWGICTRRAGKLYKARYQLYLSQILQENMRWKALAEIYTMRCFAPFGVESKNHEKRSWQRHPGEKQSPRVEQIWSQLLHRLESNSKTICTFLHACFFFFLFFFSGACDWRWTQKRTMLLGRRVGNRKRDFSDEKRNCSQRKVKFECILCE